MLSLLQEELIIAMKARDKATLTGLRNIIGKLKTHQIDKGDELTKQENINILQSLAKQLKDSIQQYQNGGREDLADTESFELKLIEKYLPEQLSEDDVRRLVQKTIVASEVKSINDMGKVMGILMKELSGSADGNMVQKIVKEELNT